MDKYKYLYLSITLDPVVGLRAIAEWSGNDHFKMLIFIFMKMITASRLLVIAAIAWIFMGTLVLLGFRHTDILALRYAGVTLLLDGILLLIVSYSCDAGIKEKKWIRAEAMVDLLFSVLLLLDPIFTLVAFPYVVGPWIVSKGVVTVTAALFLKKEVRGWAGDAVGGVLLIGCGLLIPHPMENPFGLKVLIGAIGWTTGLLYLYDAYRFRRK
jgi:uncharacterized membrane protein HdeD (DUF308 family)